MMIPKKAIALISGGLDSMLAAKMIQSQGVHVEGINFFTGFCVEGHTHAIRAHAKPKRNNALWVAETLKLPLHIIDVVEEYKSIVINPKYGFGANLNPCLDCKIFMIKKAKQWMVDHQFDFIITGEVVGQRPKSQRKMTMPLVAKESGAEDLLLRPLSAKNLSPTLPEREGWVNRELLGDFSGRSRKPQISLAQHYGIESYAQPAGGCCFLTDKHYSVKLQDLWKAQGERRYELDDIILLKVGRHLRPAPNFKLIIGREEGENNYLQGYRHQFIYLSTPSVMGPSVLIDGQHISAEDIHLAAQITARYSDGKHDSWVDVEVEMPSGACQQLKVPPMAESAIQKEWYL